jgi:hypothetical protein
MTMTTNRNSTVIRETTATTPGNGRAGLAVPTSFGGSYGFSDMGFGCRTTHLVHSAVMRPDNRSFATVRDADLCPDSTEFADDPFVLASRALPVHPPRAAHPADQNKPEQVTEREFYR